MACGAFSLEESPTLLDFVIDLEAGVIVEVLDVVYDRLKDVGLETLAEADVLGPSEEELRVLELLEDVTEGSSEALAGGDVNSDVVIDAVDAPELALIKVESSEASALKGTRATSLGAAVLVSVL